MMARFFHASADNPSLRVVEGEFFETFQSCAISSGLDRRRVQTPSFTMPPCAVSPTR